VQVYARQYRYELRPGKNITGPARYLIPRAVPKSLASSLMALGSGDPTRVICSPVCLYMHFCVVQFIAYPY